MIIEFLKKYTVYPIEDNPKMSAFYALIVGALADRFGWSVTKWIVGLIS